MGCINSVLSMSHMFNVYYFFFSSRRRHTRLQGDWSSDVCSSDLTGQIKDRVSTRLDKTVYVKSDYRAKYGDVVAVIDEIRSAGVDQLGLLTEKNQKERPAAPPPSA